MPMKSTPAYKYRFKPSKKQLKESYEVRLAAQFGNRDAKNRLAAYNRRMRERKMEVSKEEWIVCGKRFSRYQVMDYITVQVAAGESLPEVCEHEGMPTMQTVYKWMDNHPDFVREYNRSEEIRGHLMGEKAIQIALKTDRENVTADKLKVETLSKAAARANNRFQDKVVQQNLDEYSSMTEDQIRDRIKRMIEANPALASIASSLGHRVVQEIDLPVLSSETQDQDHVHSENYELAETLPTQTDPHPEDPTESDSDL